MKVRKFNKCLFLLLSGASLAAAQGTARFVYTAQTNPPISVSPGGTIPFPDTAVGRSASLSVRVSNAGTASGTVSSVTVNGQFFQLSGGPALPQTLVPNASVTFTILFAPTRPGEFTGSIVINSDTLNLEGTGIGPLLSYSYVSGGITFPVGPDNNNTVIFSPVVVGQSAQIPLTIHNVGTGPAAIASIGLSQVTGPYRLSQLPQLPFILPVDGQIQVTITFAPTALGFSNGGLQIDTTTISLVGSGTPPPPLPEYSISGPSGTVAPMSQPRVGIALASPYPLDIAGVLTLGVSGDLPSDPAVQFATGGRTVAFSIPANSTEAIFQGQGNRISLQTGTVAATIRLQPTFRTQDGAIDLISNQDALQFAVTPAAPTLIAAQVTNQTATGFVVSVTGFSTPRTLNTWRLDLTPAPDISMPVSQFTIDLGAIANAWFQRTTSQQFGGLFTLTIPLNFQGTAPDGQTLAGSIAAVGVTVTNEIGASNSVQVSTR